ncbi:unnamed protein product [Notodromas monacha]|uniref:Uncharacterized protein n=1 Tax=Notodromas monacha TaxID=399045 RepID=A0A7R9GJJ3_9CRUS|nr:unnamed protein product [Notodromas monacha]CAG0923619.1 unnamed protein product [Notodromas monacha]
MFQNMRNGDSVKISAKVMACVEAIDCAPVLCGDDRGEGFGRRRRSVDKNTTVEFQVSTLVSTTPTSISKANNKTNDFENEISVRILDRYTDGRPEAAGNNTVQLQSCRVYMLVTAVVGAVLCLLISAVTVFVMIRKCETRHKTRKHHSEAASSSSTSSSMSKANTTTSSQFDVSSLTVSSSLLPAAATHDDMATLVRAATRRRRTLRRRNEGLRGRSVDRGVEQGMTKDDAEFWLNLFQAARSDDRDTDGIVTGHNKKVQRELLRAFVEGTNNKTIYSPPSHVSSDSGYGRIGTSTWSLSRRQSETSLRDLLQEASTNSMAKTLGRNRIPKSVLRAIEQSMWTPESEDFSHDQQMSYDARRCGWTEPRKRREFPTPAPRNVTKIHVGGGGGAFQRPHNRNHSSYSDDELYAEIGNTDSTVSKASIVRGEPIMV